MDFGANYFKIFGPVASIAKFKDLEEVIKLGNNTTFGLAAAIHTKDLKLAMDASNRLRAGTIWVNTYNALHFALPFGGYKESGIGRELGKAALANYTQSMRRFVYRNLLTRVETNCGPVKYSQDCLHQPRLKSEYLYDYDRENVSLCTLTIVVGAYVFIFLGRVLCWGGVVYFPWDILCTHQVSMNPMTFSIIICRKLPGWGSRHGDPYQGGVILEYLDKLHSGHARSRGSR